MVCSWTREEQFFRSRRTEDGRAGEEAQGRSRQQDRGGKQKDLTEFVDGNIIENERAKAEVDLEAAPPADQGPAHASRMSENPRFSRSLS